MVLEGTTVLVLGAGFTKAVLPKAPVLQDDYNVDGLLRRFEAFGAVTAMLKREVRRVASETESSTLTSRAINLERLMTRLDSGMPYDQDEGVRAQHTLLLTELKGEFMRRLDEAKQGTLHYVHLKALARTCVEKGIDCITFNYDDVLDSALWNVTRRREPVLGEEALYWHPDGGYGFFCRPAVELIQRPDSTMDATSMLLLKLHGSVNWRVTRGHRTPYVKQAVAWSAEQPGVLVGDQPVARADARFQSSAVDDGDDAAVIAGGTLP